MKLALPYVSLVFLFLTSCSKYENFVGYEEVTDAQPKKVTLVSSIKHNTNESQLFDMINTYRSTIGLNTLHFESTTFYYAGLHTDYMISKGETSHDNFGERAENISKRTGAVYVAENVARNYDTLDEVLKAWLESPGHRKNIEGNYSASAISIRPNEKGDLYFTQIFFR